MTYDDFAVAFYRWAQQDFEREIVEGFPLLIRVEDSNAIRAMRFIETLNAVDREQLASGLLKRFHVRATAILRHPETDREKELVSKLLKCSLSIDCIGHWQKPQARRLISGEMHELTGQAVLWNRDEGKVTLEINDLLVSTTVDIGSAASKLMYEHSVTGLDGWKFESISVLSWYGVAFGTQWNAARSPQSAVAGFRAVANHFLSSLPVIVGA